MRQPAVSVHDVHKGFRLYHERNASLKSVLLRGSRSNFEVYEALKGVTFEVEAGHTFGLLGGNGSGKSTMLKCIAGILVPDSGTIQTRGRVASLLELGSGFHPELSGRDNVFLNAVDPRAVPQGDSPRASTTSSSSPASRSSSTLR